MACTLITILGTGLYTNGSGYRLTSYKFPDNTIVVSNLFVKTLIDAKYRDFNRIIIVGTVTSSWDILLEDNQDLWDRVIEKTVARNANAEATGIDADLADEISRYLTEKWKIETIIKFHTSKLDDDTSQEVFKVYRSIIPDINLDPENDSILFDITHGFRSMATLMYQALQFSFSKIQNIELVYGEYVGNNKPSCVRNLSSYVPYAKAADAISIFNSKLDATNLISCIKAEWPDGANALEKFSKVVQANFSLQIQETLNQINNAIKALPAEKSTILQDVVDALQPICNLRDERMSRTIYNYASFQYEHGLIVQAIISLQIAVETAIAERYGVKDAAGNNTSIGDYKWYKGGKIYDKERKMKVYLEPIGEPKLEAILKKDAEMKQKIDNLEHTEVQEIQPQVVFLRYKLFRSSMRVRKMV